MIKEESKPKKKSDKEKLFAKFVFNILNGYVVYPESLTADDDGFISYTGIEALGIRPYQRIKILYLKNPDLLKEYEKNDEIVVTNIDEYYLKTDSNFWSINKLAELELSLQKRDDLKFLAHSNNKNKCIMAKEFVQFIYYIIRAEIVKKYLNKSVDVSPIFFSIDDVDTVTPFAYTESSQTFWFYQRESSNIRAYYNTIKVSTKDLDIDITDELLEKYLQLFKVGEYNQELWKYKCLLNEEILPGREFREYCLNAISDNEVYFSQKNQLNDPFDLDYRKIDYISGDSIIDENPNYRVLCLSHKCDDVLMWSHYGDSHKGMCLKYNSQNIIDAIDANDSIKIAIFGQVNYLPKRPAFSSMKKIDEYVSKDTRVWIFQILSMFSKSKQWEYEKEFRFLVCPKDDIFDKKPLMKIPYNDICFGAKLDIEYIAHLKRIIRSRVHKFKLNKNEYLLDSEEIFLDEL